MKFPKYIICENNQGGFGVLVLRTYNRGQAYAPYASGLSFDSAARIAGLLNAAEGGE